MSRVTEPRSKRIVLTRFSISDEIAALLHAEARLHHIPVQDLIGASAKLALRFDDSQRQIWHRMAIQLRDERLSKLN